MGNELERDHRPQLHCTCCRLHWENVLIVRKSLAEAEAELARAVGTVASLTDKRDRLITELARVRGELAKAGLENNRLLFEAECHEAFHMQMDRLKVPRRKEPLGELSAYGRAVEYTERVARRAYSAGFYDSQYGRRSEDDAVAQAMREAAQ